MKLTTNIFLILFVGFLSAKNLTIEQRITPSNFELLDVEIDNGLMIIPGGLGGSSIFDISDPNDPHQIGQISVYGCDFGRVYNWEIAGEFAYAAGRDCGIAIVNISDPTSPQLVGIIDPTDTSGLDTPIGLERDNNSTENNFESLSEIRSYEDVESSNNILVAALHTDGLRFFDITIPREPLLISDIPLDNAWSVAIQENVAWVANGESGLAAVDFSEINAPVLISEIPTNGGAKDIKIQDNIAYLAVGEGGVDAFEITDPHNPVFLANYNTSGFASRVALANDRIAVSDWDDVEVIEWDNTELILAGFKNTGGRTMAIGAVGDIIYSAEWRYLQVFRYGEIFESDIDLSTRELNFPFAESGDVFTLSLDISNNGGSPLEFSSVILTGLEFSGDESLSPIAPDSTITVDVTYNASGANASGQYSFNSNDPDEPQVNVTVIGNTTGVNVGEPAPDFTLPIAYNGEGDFTLSNYLGSVVVIVYFAPW